MKLEILETNLKILLTLREIFEKIPHPNNIENINYGHIGDQKRILSDLEDILIYMGSVQ